MNRQKDRSLWDAIAVLRDEGYAIAIFSPDELEGADAGYVEDLMVQRGWDVIETIKER